MDRKKVAGRKSLPFSLRGTGGRGTFPFGSKGQVCLKRAVHSTVFSGVAGRPVSTTLNAGSLGSTGAGPAFTTSPGHIPGKASSQQRSPSTPEQLVSGSAAQCHSVQTNRHLTRSLPRLVIARIPVSSRFSRLLCLLLMLLLLLLSFS